MRHLIILGILIAAVLPTVGRAQSAPSNHLWLTHAVLGTGQTQTLVISAHDLGGNPLRFATVTARVQYGLTVQALHVPDTDSSGKTQLSFHVPAGVHAQSGLVSAVVSNGVLSIQLSQRFWLGKAPQAIQLSARVFPSTVSAGQTVFLLVLARSSAGVVLANANVHVVLQYVGRSVTLNGRTDREGALMFNVKTAGVISNQTVHVTTNISYQGRSTRQSTTFVVDAPTATPTPTFTPTPTDTPTATPTPTPTSTPTPTPTNTPMPPPLVQPVFPTSATLPTDTPVATATPLPTYTPTDAPTDTPTPTATATPVPTNTVGPTSTPTPVPNCPGSQSGCQQAVLNMINSFRAQNGVGPALQLSEIQSNGTSTCAGSYGHSVAMQESGSIWHQNALYPKQSFPNNLCISFYTAGENVGQSSGSELTALQTIHNLMISEPYTPGCSGNHACTMLDPHFRTVGIGIYYINNQAWLTEDFIG